MDNAFGKKEVFRGKKPICCDEFLMHFRQDKVAFVAKVIAQLVKTFKYILPHYSWMPGLTLPKECWQVQAREQRDKKFVVQWDIVVEYLLLTPMKL